MAMPSAAFTFMSSSARTSSNVVMPAGGGEFERGGRAQTAKPREVGALHLPSRSTQVARKPPQ